MDNRIRRKYEIIKYLNEINEGQISRYNSNKYPRWVKRIYDICFTYDHERNVNLQFYFSPPPFYEYEEEDDPIFPTTKWFEAVVDINVGIVDNLTQIDWRRATCNWDDEVTEAIVMCLDGHELQMATIDCILDVWHRDSAKVINADSYNPKFEDFCLLLKQSLTNITRYDIQSILERNSTEYSEPKETDAIDNPINVVSDNQDKQSKPKGRPIRPFEEFVMDHSKKDQVLDAIKICLTGKSDKSAALIMYAAINMGLISEPTYQSFVKQFPDVKIGQTTFNEGIKNKNKYRVDEIEGAKALLRKYMA